MLRWRSGWKSEFAGTTASTVQGVPSTAFVATTNPGRAWPLRSMAAIAGAMPRRAPVTNRPLPSSIANTECGIAVELRRYAPTGDFEMSNPPLSTRRP